VGSVAHHWSDLRPAAVGAATRDAIWTEEPDSIWRAPKETAEEPAAGANAAARAVTRVRTVVRPAVARATMGVQQEIAAMVLVWYSRTEVSTLSWGNVVLLFLPAFPAFPV
jgi:hypothetical protein